MTEPAAELRRLERLDRHTRRRATRGIWVLPILFAVLVLIQILLGIDDYRLAVAFALTASVAVMWVGYLLSRSAVQEYGTGATGATVWLIIMTIVAAAIAAPSLGAAIGWPIIALCGSALAVAAGLGVLNFKAPPPSRRDRLLLAVPVLIIVATSFGSYATEHQLGQPAAIVLGLLAQGWISRWIITR